MISKHNCRIRNLEEQFHTKGIDVSDSIKSIIEDQKNAKNDGNAFLQEWWSIQQKLQSQDSKYSHRYPPSVVK